ncbi:hypothetical protein [[Kitasatospora] papulosa]|uniref:hypothetical protein n=1 Tax=[Kitasatospora] papulosa TaxID=1464011 RepID=UPI0036B54831
MSAYRRFMLGLACGTVAGSVAALIPAVRDFWWLIALGVACLVWFGEDVLDLSR